MTAPLTCLYINLDAATERRAQLEASFQAAAPAGAVLRRVSAIDRDAGGEHAGSCSRAEKGCFLSHRRALQASLEHPGDVLIVEDDTVFSARGFGVLGGILRAEVPWDILFTDLATLSVADTFRYLRKRESFEKDGQFAVEDLASTPFAAASAYVVREHSKQTLLDLTEVAAINEGYDFALSRLVQGRALAAKVVIPFLTTIGPTAEASQIPRQETATLLALNATRRLVYVDRDLAACDDALNQLVERLTPAGRRAGLLLGAVFSDQ